MNIPEIAKNDPYLQPFSGLITEIQKKAIEKEQELLSNNSRLIDFANGHQYFGIHSNDNNFIIKEWAPNATAIWLIGEFSQWKKAPQFAFIPLENGNWELKIPKSIIKHESLYKLIINWDGGEAERIPAWCVRSIQDDNTKIFTAQVWSPENNYTWKHKNPPKPEFPKIYEAHIGMASEEGKVSDFEYFRLHRLSDIADLGYNCIQLMAIQEHPYYGSFGYHVSNFFAVSSRFGTPEQLKALIDDAHGMGLYVIMDIVHSHAVKNEIEGISKYDGTSYQFFHDGAKGDHVAWDSKCFNYAKPEVLHFLLSNCKYWLDEYHFDGFRFDGVTSMLYFDHGLQRNFMSYDDYFNENLDIDALIYLILANKLIHQINPNAITIAEDMSGYPGIAYSVENGGIGFDFRLAMGIPDYWIKIIKEISDEYWHVGDIFYQLTNKRNEEKVISYAESHDQALVGDKTIIFRLIDAEMYTHMSIHNTSLLVDRGMALHKIIRLLTYTTAMGGYLNFMGNEFGHPEWIDFPRQGNNWSYHYARRQWSLSINPDLRYFYLKEFDKALLHINDTFEFIHEYPEPILRNIGDQVLAFSRGKLLIVVNLNPDKSFTEYGIPCKDSNYKIILNTDSKNFNGFQRIDESITFYSRKNNDDEYYIQVYIPSRTALIFIEA